MRSTDTYGWLMFDFEARYRAETDFYSEVEKSPSVIEPAGENRSNVRYRSAKTYKQSAEVREATRKRVQACREKKRSLSERVRKSQNKSRRKS